MFVILLAGCGGNAGTIKNPQTTWQLNQVHEKSAEMVFSTPIGWQALPLGGQAGDQSPRVLLDKRFHVHAVDPSGTTWVLGDSQTNFFVWRRGKDPAPVEIKALSRRAGTVAVTWEANLAVVSRHADFSRPQAQWADDEDDCLVVVDLRSLATRVIEPANKLRVQQMLWEASTGAGQTPKLYLTLVCPGAERAPAFRVDVAKMTRTKIDAIPKEVAYGRHRGVAPDCAARGALTSGDDGIFLEEEKNANNATENNVTKDNATALVHLEGRERGFHDYQPSFQDVRFGPSCKLVYFVFKRTLYTVTADAPHRVAELAGGISPFFFEAPAPKPMPQP